MNNKTKVRAITDESHVFISFVHENHKKVRRLVDALEKHGVRCWTDKDIPAGKDWRSEIRSAIQKGHAFAACFSPKSLTKKRSYMHAELQLAIEELQIRPLDQSWFIPIKLFECDIPKREIGGNRTLHHLQWVELHKNWEQGIEKIVTAILASK